MAGGVVTVKFVIASRRMCRLALLALVWPCATWAQEQAEALDHMPLVIDAGLDFRAVFEQALRNSPRALEAPVREEQARDFSAAGQSWIAGPPSLQVNTFDDSLLDDTGQLELEYGVQLPLWRPGERRDARRLGDAYTRQSAAFEDYLRLEVAGLLRANLADIHEAEVLLELERQATAEAEELLRVTSALAQAGEVAELEALQARTLLLEQNKNELRAEAALIDAERSYTVLTGLVERPRLPFTETFVAREEVGDEHPLLRFLQTGVSLADAGIRQAEQQARGNPTLSIGGRRERGDAFEPYTDSLNLSVSIPFGGRSFVSSRSSAARRDKVDAEVGYLQARRELNAVLHEVEHELFLAGESLELAREQAELSDRRAEMARAAFEQGETTLAQVVLALQQARAAAREYRLLEMRRERLVGEFNQTIGVLP